jgi:fibronectin type 3 domain-containing protein
MLLLSGISGVLLVFGIFLFASCGGDDDDDIGEVFGVTAEALSTSSIGVSWSGYSGSADPTSFNVYRNASYGGTYEKVGSSTTRSYTDTGLSPNTTYYYRVSVVTSKGEGPAASGPYDGTTTSAIDPPANVTAEVGTLSSIRISWDEVAGATGYNVYYCRDNPEY